jgi:hypothetical protein
MKADIIKRDAVINNGVAGATDAAAAIITPINQSFILLHV